MKEHERIPQDRKMLQLSPGLMKTLITTATEAIPTELPERHLRWLTEGHGRHRVIAEAIGNALYRPPTLKNTLPQWRRFYALLFNCEMPKLDDSICDEFAAGFVIVGRSLWTNLEILSLAERLPGVFCQGFTKEVESLASIITLREQRNFPWYIMGLGERDYKDNSFEYPPHGQQEAGVSFHEVLVQQLFEFISGRPLSHKWLYANGSRTKDDLVPGLIGKDGKIAVGYFKRGSIHYNVEHKQTCKFG
jgi:hypothetical protein